MRHKHINIFPSGQVQLSELCIGLMMSEEFLFQFSAPPSYIMVILKLYWTKYHTFTDNANYEKKILDLTNYGKFF